MARSCRMLHHKKMRVFSVLFFLVTTSGIWSQVTYNKDIAPILEKNCVSCHQEGEIGPMPLTSYLEVSSYATMIKFVTDIKLMPPFKADGIRAHYINERAISENEKALIQAWIEGGLTEGSFQDSKKRSIINDHIQEHDTTICMAESFEHYGIFYDQYQVFVLPTHFSKGRIVKDIYFQPGNKEIVRSAQISLAPQGAAISMDNWDPRYGYYSFGGNNVNSSHPNWYSWMPNTNGLALSKEENLYIPPEAEILLHIHYGPYGRVQKDSSCIHLSFEEDLNTSHLLQNVPLVSTDFLKDSFLITQGKKHRISSSFVLPVNTELKSVTPLAHLLCRTMEVFAVLPDKSTMPLLTIKDWDFHWKEKYIFQRPIQLPAGTKIFATAIYDNTSSNPYNPASPPHPMKSGTHMFDENFMFFFEFLNSTNPVAYFQKPYVITENNISELQFTAEKKGMYEIQIIDLDSSNIEYSTSASYESGNHTIRSSEFPNSKGRYVATIYLNGKLMDAWWVILK